MKKTFWAVLDEWEGGMIQWRGLQLYVTFEADEDASYDELRRRAINECKRINGNAEYGVFHMGVVQDGDDDEQA